MSTTRPVDDTQAGLGRILVPLDGSRLSAKALELATRLPARELILLHVGKHDRAGLEALAAPLRTGGRTVEVVIRSGDTADEIMNAAADCDLVVMTTRGRGAAGRILFGSIADRISRFSSTPTLLVRTHDETAAVPVPARIVAPLDGSDLAERALPMAAHLARGMSLPLHLVRVVDLDNVRATIHEQRQADHGSATSEEHTYEEARQFTEQRASAYLTETAASLVGEGLEVETSILQGTPVFELLRAIEADDLVVMTSHGRKGFRRWMLGSVAEKLVRESAAPVLLVPTREPAATAEPPV
ncbi:MAG: universal stress protein [Chloroflexota bacterium]|nr:universal stress protein [Chloroflexota bacterium]